MEQLEEKNLINEELKEKLERYSDVPVVLPVEAGRRVHQGPERFCPYAPSAWFKDLRDSLHIHLPHPTSFQRWLDSVDAGPALNKIILDTLERRRQEDEVKYGVSIHILDVIKNHVQYDPQT